VNLSMSIWHLLPESDVMSSLTVLAEQAMLGTVLADPAAQQHVLDLVEPADFQRPWHAQVLAAMRGVQKHGGLPRAAEVYAELRCDPDLPGSVSADAVPLADLIAASPHSQHALTYAAIVVESGIRRRLELAGSRLAQATESEDLDAAVRQCARVRHELRACHARWLAIPEPLRGGCPRARSGLADRDTARRADAVRAEVRRLREDLRAGRNTEVRERIAVLARSLAETASRIPTQTDGSGNRVAELARPQGHEAEVAGQQALRDLAAGPIHIAHVRRWLQPEHFAGPEDGELFVVMRDLDAAGRPVDPVTIAWEAAKRGIQVDPAKLADGNAPFAVATAREVHRYGLLAQAAATGRDLQADAVDPACHLPGLFQSAENRLRALMTARQSERRPGPQARVITMPRQTEPSERSRRPGREAVP
jgi:DnaB-like helicase N terminal domain